MAGVERLEADEAARLRALRLRALDDAPEAFGSSHDQEAAADDAWWQRMAGYAWWIAVDGDGADVGLVSGGRREGDDVTRWVYSMWVDPSARGTGVAEDLLDAVAAWARDDGATRLGLDVTDHAPRARRCYERYGFRPTGVVVPLPRDRSISLVELAMPLPLGPDGRDARG